MTKKSTLLLTALMVTLLIAPVGVSASEPFAIAETPSVEAIAEDVIRDFATDAASAQQKYAGGNVTISGIVNEKAQPKDNVPETDASYVIFGSPEYPQWSVQCYFDSTAASSLELGQMVTVRGQFQQALHPSDDFHLIVFHHSEIVQ